VLLKNVRHLGGRRAAKPTISRKPEVRQVFARGRNPLRKARHVVNDPEIDAGTTRPQICERREKRFIAAIKHRNVHPVDAPGRRFDQRIGEVHGFATVRRAETRPAAERAEAKVVTERDIGGDLP